MAPSELEIALGSTSTGAALPAELPIAHLTTARWLKKILDAGSLLPRSCKVFGQDLLYFSYGGVFYRSSKMQTENVAELPVGMVFTPQVLDACMRIFPFDSGAMAAKSFGDRWYTAMQPFDERFSIGKDLSTSARLLIHNLYQTNAKYLEGRPARKLAFASPTLQLLHDFLTQDQSGSPRVLGGIDHRQRSIEALSSVPVSLANELIWIGLPHHRLAKALKAIRRDTRRIPQIYPYHYSKNFDPDSVAEILQRVAYDDVIKRYLK
jgi:hypothetical protein